MSKLKPKRPSLGTILGLTALVVAVVSTANAAPSRVIVHKGDIAPGAVNAKALAKGSVTSAKLGKGAVTAAKLRKGSVQAGALAKGSVTAAALARDAVTAGALAPGAVYAGALGTISVQTKPIADLDTVVDKNWTASNTETALCAPGEQLLGAGFAFTDPGNSEVGWLQALPVINGETRGVTGRITSNSGGTAKGQVAAVCLK